MQAAVLNLSVTSAKRIATSIRELFPKAQISVDERANALIVMDNADNLQQIRAVVQGLDVRSPNYALNEVIQLRVLSPQLAIYRLHPLYPNVKFEVASKTSVLVRAPAETLTEIRTLLSNLDIVPPTAAPAIATAEAIRITFARPRDVARSLENQLSNLRASVAGASIVLAGSPEQVQRAKILAQSIDVPPLSAVFNQVYRLHSVDAAAAAELVKSTYPRAHLTIDKDLNAIAVSAAAADQLRIAGAVAQLDSQSPPGSAAAYGTGNIAVVDLDTAIPGINGSPSTTAQDIAAAVQQVLQGMVPDLHITVPANSTSIILAGSPSSIRLARALIERLDQQKPLVVLDTEVLEVSENAAKNIGLQFPGAVIQSQFSEIQPTPNPITGQPGRLSRPQAMTRTGVQFTAALNFLIQQGSARVLANPRVTTLSGHTATIRAGDTINIITQTAGGVGTPVTQQLQQFNTGVTLDITPSVGQSGKVTVALHPVVNSLAGLLNDVPQIATRDTQTVVQLRDNETLVIGGLIQETTQRQISKLPLLGDIPLVGKLFENSNVQSQRNELVIVVTPHIVKTDEASGDSGSELKFPTPEPLPSLPQGMALGTSPVVPKITRSQELQQASSSSVIAANASSSPLPTPTAFSNTNVFVYGVPPANTFARETDAPQIFFAQLSPTVVEAGVTLQLSVITTTNVQRVEVGCAGSVLATLARISSAKWQGTFSFSCSGLSSSAQTTTLAVSAYNSQHGAATIQIPVSVASTP